MSVNSMQSIKHLITVARQSVFEKDAHLGGMYRGILAMAWQYPQILSTA